MALNLWRPLLPHGCRKHPVPDRVKRSFVIFDIRALWRSGCFLYSCTHVATVGVRGLTTSMSPVLKGSIDGLRHQGRPKTQWMDDIEEWSGCSYIQLKEMSQDREQWRRKTIEWSSTVANRHRRWSTSEWVRNFKNVSFLYFVFVFLCIFCL